MAILPSLRAQQVCQIIVVTGMSGAGKMSVMRALEDFGFYCVDNLPVPLLKTFLNFISCHSSSIVKVAIGIDVRSRTFIHQFRHEIEKTKQSAHLTTPLKVKIIFLTSSPHVIVKRFQETRRKHPLAKGISVQQAITREHDILQPVKEIADTVLDTDQLNIHELRRWVRTWFTQDQQEMIVTLISFGFKYGLPVQSDIVYDIRFLPNPYFVPSLKLLDGRSNAIQEFLFGNDIVEQYWSKLTDFLHYSLNQSYKEGRFFVNVSIGCTGGRHRSVAFVERLMQQKWDNITFLRTHRDIEKSSKYT